MTTRTRRSACSGVRTFATVRPRVPEPDLAVRVAAVGQPLGGDVHEGAAQDGQLVPAGEPAAVAVDLGMDVVPGLCRMVP